MVFLDYCKEELVSKKKRPTLFSNCTSHFFQQIPTIENHIKRYENLLPSLPVQAARCERNENRKRGEFSQREIFWAENVALTELKICRHRFRQNTSAAEMSAISR